MREPKSVSVCSMTAERRQMRRGDGKQPPDADRGDAAAATAVADGPGFGAGAMGWDATLPGAMRWALAGDGQETHEAAGTRGVSQKRNGTVMLAQPNRCVRAAFDRGFCGRRPLPSGTRPPQSRTGRSPRRRETGVSGRFPWSSSPPDGPSGWRRRSFDRGRSRYAAGARIAGDVSGVPGARREQSQIRERRPRQWLRASHRVSRLRAWRSGMGSSALDDRKGGPFPLRPTTSIGAVGSTGLPGVVYRLHGVRVLAAASASARVSVDRVAGDRDVRRIGARPLVDDRAGPGERIQHDIKRRRRVHIGRSGRGRNSRDLTGRRRRAGLRVIAASLIKKR